MSRKHRCEEQQEERQTGTYGVEVAPGQNDVVILAVTVGIDLM